MFRAERGERYINYSVLQTGESIIPKHWGLIIPVGAALLVLEQVCKRGGIGCDTETPGLPGTGRHPGYGYIEAVQVVGRRDLGCRKFHRHQVQAAAHLYREGWRNLHAAVEAQGLRVLMPGNQLIVRILI